MKKSLIALAVLGAFAGVASAQSSVTVYGFIDQGVGKAIGSTDKTLLESGGSRLGFKGSEDLGGGLKANFGIEHRLTPNTGASTSANFWNGYSTVGLSGGFGTLNLGRQYTPTFLMVQNAIDPFLGDTVGNLRDTGLRDGSTTTIRVATSLRYDYSANGFALGVSIADTATNGAVPNRPFALALTYANGPIWVGIGRENTGAEGTDAAGQTTFGVTYNFGMAKVALGINKGTQTDGDDVDGKLLGVTVPVGGGDFKLGLAKKEIAGNAVASKTSIGYHYYLSKKTEVYADVSKDGEVKTDGTGYDLGIRVRF